MCACLLLFAVVACGGDDTPPPSEVPPNPPAGDNDPAFTVERVRNWYLIGNDLTEGRNTLDVEVTAPDGVELVDLWIDDQPGIRLSHSGESFAQIVDIAELEPGEHELLLAADGADTAFARLTFTRSHPLYVLVSTDWDDADNPDSSLDLQQQLHDNHPDLRLTHFVGPYTFTDDTVTEDRRNELVAWVLDKQDRYDDEIGLHIHPYCNFVETAGVTCKTQPSFLSPAGDETGYTVVLSSYTQQEVTSMLERADELFAQYGLGKPTSFRAGGWAAELNVLRALADVDYVVDTSANNWARLEEWDSTLPGQAGRTLYEWNQEHWATIGDTSQPYYPNDTDILSDAAPNVPLLEVPDNGILVDYVSYLEMVEIFHANWPGGALAQPTVFQIGYHPPNFNYTYMRNIDGALDETDLYRASKDAGPVVYATLSEMTLVWQQPN